MAHSHGERLVLIDVLIHRYHWEHAGESQARPAACSLIEGSMKSTAAFLDRLSYGDHTPECVIEMREQWRRIWRGNDWSRGRGQ